MDYNTKVGIGIISICLILSIVQFIRGKLILAGIGIVVVVTYILALITNKNK